MTPTYGIMRCALLQRGNVRSKTGVPRGGVPTTAVPQTHMVQ
jgi:hypothetical protein